MAILFGDKRQHEKKKLKKSLLEKKAQKQLGTSWQLPQVEIIKKGKKEW